MARIALDADVVIAFLDEGDAQHDRGVEELRRLLAAGDDVLVSASVYAEVMVRPLQQGAGGTVDDFLAAVGASIVLVDREAARLAAQLRARHRALRLPDALSLATAVASQAELLTLDHRLRRIAAREQAATVQRPEP